MSRSAVRQSPRSALPSKVGSVLLARDVEKAYCRTVVQGIIIESPSRVAFRGGASSLLFLPLAASKGTFWLWAVDLRNSDSVVGID